MVLYNSIPGTELYMVEEMGVVVLRTTTVTTGVIAINEAITFADLENFQNRYQLAFADCLLLECDWLITPIAASTGISKAWVSEVTTLTPVSLDAQVAKPVTNILNTNANGVVKPYVVKYRVQKLDELIWNRIPSLPTLGARFYLYTNTADFGATIVATPILVTQFRMKLALRGRVA
jgi:hypothetical protein